MFTKNSNVINRMGLAIAPPLIAVVVALGLLAQAAQAQGYLFDDDPNNLIENGNFESGFYSVPQLGFEPQDVGNVPNGWNWFKNQAFGKYNIYNNEAFGLICEGDINNTTIAKDSLTLHMQSTDQPDARLGVYQTVDVVPGQTYRFSMSGTIQSMVGSRESSNSSHEVQLVFDHTGGTDWEAIPFEQWTLLPWGEYLLEFKVSGPADPDLAIIEDYETTFKATSNKVTIFLAAYRRWADWRSVRYTFDCLKLEPISAAAAVSAPLDEPSTPTDKNGVQEAAVAIPSTAETEAGPSAETSAETETTVVEAPSTIPDSGGILESEGNSLWIVVVSVIVIGGLVTAGVWNISRKRTG